MVAVIEIREFPMSRSIVPTKLLYKNGTSPYSFQQAMKIPLILLQVFGYFPLKGITGSSYRELKFRWMSWRALLSSFCFMGHLFQFICYCITRRIDKLLVLNGLLFHLEAFVLSGLFIALAGNWPKFVKEWHVTEVCMKNYEASMNLQKKIRLVLVFILGLALIEHCMATSKTVITVIKKRKDLATSLYEFDVHMQFIEIFTVIPHHIVLGIIFQCLVIQKTFMWTFVDVFIILISVCFTFRLKQIAKKIAYLSKIEISDENIWRTIREDYVKLSRLCDQINKHLSWFIIVSFSANIYHILSQLFSSLRPIEDTFQKIYFYLSFSLLILRVITVCIFGGGVYDEYENITRIITTVPSDAFNIEVERFVMNLTTCETALTGKNFFNITRNLILKVTSAIVTYELVLIQFNEQEFKTKDL